jgi:hypothetical protein
MKPLIVPKIPANAQFVRLLVFFGQGEQIKTGHERQIVRVV